MKHLVVVAHPRETSFTMDVMRTYVATLRARHHEVVVRDLYRLGFNPIASPEDINAIRHGLPIPKDIAEEQAHLLWADVVTFLYPVWWIALPAMLKGYVDRVFMFGFAYGHTASGVRGLLAGKKAMVFSSSGSTREHFDETGKMAAVNTAIQLGTLEFCDLEVLEHVHFAPVGRFTTQAMVDGWLDDVRALVARYF